MNDVATGQPLKSLVTNDGKIRANGGRVELTAAAARAVVDSVINTSGVIKANSIGRRNGMIVLAAATGGSKPAGLPTQTVKISGKLSAAGRHKNTKGGTILVTGEDIKLAHAKLDASGRAGGGKVLIGGDWGGGHPNTSLVDNASAKLEGFAIPTATTVSVDRRDHHQCLGDGARQRRQGDPVVGHADHVRRHHPRARRRARRRRRFRGDLEPRQLPSQRQCRYGAPQGTAGTLLLDPQDTPHQFGLHGGPNCIGPCPD